MIYRLRKQGAAAACRCQNKTMPFDPASADHLPDLQGDVAIPGLTAAIDLRRDAWGIPHIRATSRNDAFAGLGFAHAQDRLWQMEALLRRGTGRFAEWVGKPALAADILARQIDTEGVSRREAASPFICRAITSPATARSPSHSA